MKNLFCAAIAATSLSLAGAAAAGAVYDNGGPDGVSGNEATAWLQAEDFSLGADATITGATVSLASSFGFGSFDGAVEYWIFADSEGSPAGALANGTTTGTLTPGGPVCCDFTGATLAFDFNDGFQALAGEQYWFGFHLGSDYNRHEIYWNSTGCELCLAVNNGHESFGGTQDNWLSNGQEHAFTLTSNVPEPASWALMILGFGGVGAMVRSRRRVIA